MNAMSDNGVRGGRRENVSVVVVIPFYNGSEFIERSARSVLEQTMPATEFIVVDDGSRADEAERLDAIAARMGFRVLRKENGGQGSARNAGVAASSADYICFLDQDDFYLRNHIELLVDALPGDDPHFGWVYGELYEADRDGNVFRTSIVSHHAINPKTDIFDLLKYDMFVLPSASLIARSAFEAVGGFDPQFTGYEDDDLFLRIFRKGYTNHFIRKAVTVWCIHAESTSYGIRMARSRLRYFKKLAAMFPDDPDKDRYYLKDVILPRFQKAVVKETAAAFFGWPDRFRRSKKDYIALAEEFADEVDRSGRVSAFRRFRLRLLIGIMKTDRLDFLFRSEKVGRFAYRVFTRLRRSPFRGRAA